MDLSKAFDLIPHDLLVAKLHAYGFSLDACTLIKNYLTNRNQRVTINNKTSEWQNIKSGVPQGSIAGPVLFNVFINDLVVMLQDHCSVFNYADDNTLSFNHADRNVVKNTLERSASLALEWFEQNSMKANPTKFQALVLSKNSRGDDMIFELPNNVTVRPSTHVKLLGMYLDKNLNFAYHIDELVKKCSKQINAIARISTNLSAECRLLVFNAFLMSNLNYCSSVYHFCRFGDAKKLEVLQKRCLRFILRDFNSSYHEMLEHLNFPTLYVRRLRGVMECIFKILNDGLPPLDSSFFTLQPRMYELRRLRTVVLPRCNSTKYGLRSLCHDGASCWNSLPNNIKTADDVYSFKKLLTKWNPDCSCNNHSCHVCCFKRL